MSEIPKEGDIGPDSTAMIHFWKVNQSKLDSPFNFTSRGMIFINLAYSLTSIFTYFYKCSKILMIIRSIYMFS